MQDLELARLRLRERDISLVVVKNGSFLLESVSHGISGFLEAIDFLGEELAGSSVADRVVGRAIALLCVYSRVSAVFAVTMSVGGARVLEDRKINYQSERRVPNILNRRRSAICPFEELAITFKSPEEAYSRLRLTR